MAPSYRLCFLLEDLNYDVRVRKDLLGMFSYFTHSKMGIYTFDILSSNLTQDSYKLPH